MAFISDLLLAGGAFGAAIYCLILSRRLRTLTGLDSTLGTAIAVLSQQVDELSGALKGAESAALGASARLDGQTRRAEALASRLELLSAALHDLPETEPYARPAEQSPTLRPFTRHVLDEPEASPSRSRLVRRRAQSAAGALS